MERELPRYKMLVEQWVGKPCMQVCCPRGAYTIRRPESPVSMALSSSPTRVPGTNPFGTYPHRLRSILVRRNLPALGSEAPLSGLSELVAPYIRAEPQRE